MFKLSYILYLIDITIIVAYSFFLDRGNIGCPPLFFFRILWFPTTHEPSAIINALCSLCHTLCLLPYELSAMSGSTSPHAHNVVDVPNLDLY